MSLETHFQYENSVLGRFGHSGLQRKKNPNCHNYATFEGSFLCFHGQKIILNNFKNTLASALKSYMLQSREKYKKKS
jgi:hypothetical protein